MGKPPPDIPDINDRCCLRANEAATGTFVPSGARSQSCRPVVAEMSTALPSWSTTSTLKTTFGTEFWHDCGAGGWMTLGGGPASARIKSSVTSGPTTGETPGGG